MAALDGATVRIIDQIRAASADRRPLHIRGGRSKDFLALSNEHETLDATCLRGIVSYEPTELVITARAGTALSEINSALAARGQMLGFEPPQLSPASTLGGVVSCGWSGPARPYRGSARDFVLGAKVINGHGQELAFGGQVMKNVAGYDVSRLLAGAFGTLGVVSEISLRVVPVAAVSRTLLWPMAHADAAARMRTLAREPWPVSAMAAWPDELAVRVSGSEEAVADAERRLAPARSESDPQRWLMLRDLSAPELSPPADHALWRLSLPPAAPPPPTPVLVSDWGGAQRWAHARTDDSSLHDFCRTAGGHATALAIRPGAASSALAAPSPALQKLMRKIKIAFDPVGIFNPGTYFNWM